MSEQIYNYMYIENNDMQYAGWCILYVDQRMVGYTASRVYVATDRQTLRPTDDTTPADTAHCRTIRTAATIDRQRNETATPAAPSVTEVLICPKFYT